MDKVDTLNPTLGAVDAGNTDDIEVKRETRHLKHWIVKVLVVCFAVVFISIVLSMSYVFIVRGDTMHEGILGKLFDTFMEIITFMMTEA